MVESAALRLPLIDISGLINPEKGDEAKQAVAREIDQACRQIGFFRITGHGVPEELQKDLDKYARDFFDLPEDDKTKVKMALGGSAWRGWFPVGGELTSGLPDQKEGLYCGYELSSDHPSVVAGTPLHGPNLYPESPAELGPLINKWFAAMSSLGKALLRGVALGLKMPENWFEENLCKPNSIELFRIFHYPSPEIKEG